MDVQLRKDELCRKSMLLEISTLLPNPERYIVASSSSICDADRLGTSAFRKAEQPKDCQSYFTEKKHRCPAPLYEKVNNNRTGFFCRPSDEMYPQRTCDSQIRNICATHSLIRENSWYKGLLTRRRYI